MKVFLTFDVEVWCPDWHSLDKDFAASFDRYVYGRSAGGEFALPRTCEILKDAGLVGVFFVEPLFSLRFGSRYLETMTDIITAAGQDVQLHLHPEWTDEIRPPLIDDVSKKRQHLAYYSAAEQAALIGAGKHALEAALSKPVYAFRAGSFAVNRATYSALEAVGLHVDSSLNDVADYSEGSIDYRATFASVRRVGSVTSYPISVFRDGFGGARPLQVGACSLAEMQSALLNGQRAGCQHMVLVSHNFEMLKPGRSEPDPIVVKRFEGLCAFLRRHADLFEVGPYPQAAGTQAAVAAEVRPHASAMATTRRYVEQALRRLS